MRSILVAHLVPALLAAQTARVSGITTGEIDGHLRFLSSDLLEGRATGSRGYDIAARYVSSQFEALGLKPGGKDGWYQDVQFVTASADPSRVSGLTSSQTAASLPLNPSGASSLAVWS